MLSMKENVAPVESNKPNADSPMTAKVKQFNNLALNLDADFDEVATQKFEDEPVLAPNTKRFVLFPIQYNGIWKVYKNAEAKFWSAEEIELADDKENWEQLPGKEKSFICSSVAILSANDCWMETVLVAKLSDDIQIPEARCFFGFMIMQRNIHSELFTVMLDMFTDGFSDRDAILESCKNLSGMQSRKAWVERYITDTTDHFSVRILASAFYNYMSYLTITDTLMHVTRAAEQGGEKVKLPGLVRSLSKFQRDHKSYYEFYSIISDILVNKVPQKQAETMARELVGIESMFMDELMELAGGSLELAGTKVNPKLIKERLGYHADLCLAGMGYRSVYKTKDPLPWIAEAILREARKDDHEHGIQGPTKANVQATPKKTMEEQVFSLSDDF